MRVPDQSDIPFVVDLMSRHAAEPASAEALQLEWSSPGVDLDRDARVDDEGYALVESLDSERAWLNLQGRPSAQLLDWALDRAAEVAPRVFSGGWSTDDAVLTAVRSRAFEHVRSSYRMLIDLTRPTEEPHWPDDISVRPFEEGDEEVFFAVQEETFRDMWEPIEQSYDEWTHWFLVEPTFSPSLWFLAHEGGEPAGVAICHPHRTRRDHGWVRILGVRRPWRRRGLGRALLLHAFASFREAGLVGAGLGVDSESETGANRLYESVGMHVAARFDIVEWRR